MRGGLGVWSARLWVIPIYKNRTQNTETPYFAAESI